MVWKVLINPQKGSGKPPKWWAVDIAAGQIAHGSVGVVNGPKVSNSASSETINRKRREGYEVVGSVSGNLKDLVEKLLHLHHGRPVSALDKEQASVLAAARNAMASASSLSLHSSSPPAAHATPANGHRITSENAFTNLSDALF